MKYFEIGLYIGNIIFWLIIISPFIPFLRKAVYKLIKANEFDVELFVQTFYRVLSENGFSAITEENIVAMTAYYFNVIVIAFIIGILISFFYPLVIFFIVVLSLFYLLSKFKKTNENN